MPNSCVMIGCTNREGKNGVKMFRIPAKRTGKVKGKDIVEISTRRQLLWIKAINRKDIRADTIKSSFRVCCEHFNNGEPANYLDETNPDWVPHLKLKTIRSEVKKFDKRKKGKLNQGAPDGLMNFSSALCSDTDSADEDETCNSTGVASQTDVTGLQLDQQRKAFEDIQSELLKEIVPLRESKRKEKELRDLKKLARINTDLLISVYWDADNDLKLELSKVLKLVQAVLELNTTSIRRNRKKKFCNQSNDEPPTQDKDTGSIGSHDQNCDLFDRGVVVKDETVSRDVQIDDKGEEGNEDNGGANICGDGEESGSVGVCTASVGNGSGDGSIRSQEESSRHDLLARQNDLNDTESGSGDNGGSQVKDKTKIWLCGQEASGGEQDKVEKMIKLRSLLKERPSTQEQVERIVKLKSLLNECPSTQPASIHNSKQTQVMVVKPQTQTINWWDGLTDDDDEVGVTLNQSPRKSVEKIFQGSEKDVFKVFAEDEKQIIFMNLRTATNVILHKTNQGQIQNCVATEMSNPSPTIPEEKYSRIPLPIPMPIKTFGQHKSIRSQKEDGPLNHCKLCDKTFKSRILYNAHKRIIHPVSKDFQCTVCGKCFVTPSKLDYHMRYHTGEKPYICDFCGKSFRQCTNLRKHRMIHTGEKPHKCHICDMAFIQRSSLKIHLESHPGEKVNCPICEKRVAKSYLKNHYETKHSANTTLSKQESP